MLKTIGVLMVSFMATSALAADIKLPAPDKTNTTTLIQALEQRHSDYGVNRTDGKRTIPTALDKKDLNVYVFNSDGIWLYDADENTLKKQSSENKLDLFRLQDYMNAVSTVLVYTGSTEDYAVMHAGAAYQNVELYAAATNMASIVRGYFEHEKVAQALNLPAGQRVIISQAIGWKK